MRGASQSVSLLAAAVLLPTLAFAQGSLTGTVRDESSAVLPGVTVEASSPALIEKVRTALTDGAGQYRITGLNPGIYALTFRLAGFNIVRREGIELGGTVANGNAYNAARWDWVGDPSVTARQLQGREMYIGRFTAQVSDKHRVSFNQDYQRRCEGSPLKLDVDGCNTRPGLDRGGNGDRVARGQSQLLWQYPVSRDAGVLDRADHEQAAAGGGLHAILVQGRDDGQGPTGGDFRSDLRHRAVHRDQSRDRTGVCAAGELRPSGRADRHPELRQPEQLARLCGVRHRLPRPEGRLPGRLHPGQLVVPRARVAGVLPVQPGVPNQFTFRLPSGTSQTARRRRRRTSRTRGRGAG